MRMHGTNELAEASGIIALETPDGQQSWAMIVDAQIRYDEDVTISNGDAAQFTLIATLKPGEMLREAHTDEPGEENVLVYSRLLVALLREERERYAALEKDLGMWRRTAQDLLGQRDAVNRTHAEELRSAWQQGVAAGWFEAQPGRDRRLGEVLEKCPHPAVEPDHDEDEGDEL